MFFPHFEIYLYQIIYLLIGKFTKLKYYATRVNFKIYSQIFHNSLTRETIKNPFLYLEFNTFSKFCDSRTRCYRGIFNNRNPQQHTQRFEWHLK